MIPPGQYIMNLIQVYLVTMIILQSPLIIMITSGSGVTTQMVWLSLTGTTWTVYNESNSGLPGNHISSITVDDSGTKWIAASGRGLVKFDDTNWTVYDTSNSGLPSNHISSIDIDDSGTKWIATYGGAVASYDDTNWTVYNSSNSEMPDYWIESIAIDENGYCWIGWNSNNEWFPPRHPSVDLAKFDGSTWTSYEVSNSGILNNNIHSIAVDANGIMWIGWGRDDPYMGGSLGGLAKFDGSTWTVYDGYNVDLLNQVQTIKSIAIDDNGIKWFGTHRRGLLKFDGTTWTLYDTSNSGLPSIWDRSSIAIDDNGNKWIGGSEHGGLAKFDGTTWTVYNSSNSSLPGDWIRSIVIDNSGNKWIGTDNGLAKFDGTTWTVYNSTNSGLIENKINTLAVDNENNIWIGTDYDGPSWYSKLIKFDGITWTVYDLSSTGLENNYVFTTIAIDDNGSKWIGLRWRGLVKFDETTGTVYNMANSGLPGNQILALTLDDNGNKWIGTENGLAVYKEGGVILGLEDNPAVIQNIIPDDFVLQQNYPNPFNPITTIQYKLPQRSEVQIIIYDLLGRKVIALVSETQDAGYKTVQWDATNVPSGMYFYQIRAGEFVQTRKMVLLK